MSQGYCQKQADCPVALLSPACVLHHAVGQLVVAATFAQNCSVPVCRRRHVIGLWYRQVEPILATLLYTAVCLCAGEGVLSNYGTNRLGLFWLQNFTSQGPVCSRHTPDVTCMSEGALDGVALTCCSGCVQEEVCHRLQ